MICDQCNLSISQIIAKFLNGQLDGKGFSFCGNVPVFGMVQRSGNVQNQVFLPTEDLGQFCAEVYP